jgi:NAD(P)-dependent dehydrogenase (short-subunit alcohol dehydrogenase family)
MQSLFSVEGMHVLVTGGSRGIGAMIARGFLEGGATVYISSRKAEACDATAAELCSVGPCVSLPGDISTAGGVRALASAVREHTPRLHVLVNNAGATWGAPLEEYPRESFDKVISTNLTGVFELTIALLPLLRAARAEANSASVINIGSIEGTHAFGNTNYAYPASKAAVHMLTRHLAVTLGPEQIRVNAIAPGAFYTKMVAYIFDVPEQLERIVTSTPLGRILGVDGGNGAK